MCHKSIAETQLVLVIDVGEVSSTQDKDISHEWRLRVHLILCSCLCRLIHFIRSIKQLPLAPKCHIAFWAMAILYMKYPGAWKLLTYNKSHTIINIIIHA
jgi:hypothetical protein